MKSIWLIVVLVAVLTLNELPFSVCFNLVPQRRPPKTQKPVKVNPCKADKRSRSFELGSKMRKSFKTRAGDGKTVLCRRLNNTELTKMISCSGTFKQKFAATSLEFALKKRENLIPKISGKGRFQNQGRRKNPKLPRVKRDNTNPCMNISSGSTKICNCVNRFDIDQNTGLGLPCGLCSTTYRQATNSRFPEYLNGIVCHPNETATVVNALNTPIGKCVQDTFSQDFLEWTGEWEIDEDKTAQLGGNNVAYKEKWVFYRQTINSSCSFKFFVT